MTGRERLLAVLRREEPDRVPVSPFVQEDFLSYYFPEVEVVYRVEHGVKCAKELGFDVMTRDLTYTVPYFLKKSFDNWNVEHSEELLKGNLYRRISITTPEGKLEQIEVAPYNKKTISGIHFTTSKYFFEDMADWEIFKKFVPEIDQDSILEMKEKAISDNKIIGDTGISCPWGWGGVYNMASTYRNIESLMMDPYLYPEFYKDYMDTLSDMMKLNYSLLADTEFDCLGMQGNIANSALLSPVFFDEFIAPYEKKIIDEIHSKGKFVLYHNCGYATNFYDSYMKLGMDIWETVSPFPQGDNSLKSAKDAIGDKLILAGNLDQVDFLKKANVSEVEEATKEVMRTGKKGGNYIFACSDFLEKDTPIENIKTMINCAIKEG